MLARELTLMEAQGLGWEWALVLNEEIQQATFTSSSEVLFAVKKDEKKKSQHYVLFYPVK